MGEIVKYLEKSDEAKREQRDWDKKMQLGFVCVVMSGTTKKE